MPKNSVRKGLRKDCLPVDTVCAIEPADRRKIFHQHVDCTVFPACSGSGTIRASHPDFMGTSLLRPDRLLLPTLLIFLVVFSGMVWADDNDEDPEMRRRMGFRYFGGYDVNTVKTVEGEVVRIDIPEHGPAFIDVLSGGKPYRVVAGPQWIWREIKVPLKSGDRVRIRGSLVQGRDSSLYVLAAEIWLSDHSESFVRLRDSDGLPMWMMGRHRMGGAMEHRAP